MKQYITHTHTLTHRRTHAVPDVDKTDATTLGFCLSTSERVWMSGQDSARRSLERFLRHITVLSLDLSQAQNSHPPYTFHCLLGRTQTAARYRFSLLCTLYISTAELARGATYVSVNCILFTCLHTKNDQ